MTNKQLKLLAANIINESELLSNKSKIQYLRFINEADKTQLKSFILDGKINILDYESKIIVENRFENYLNIEKVEFLNYCRESICDFMETKYDGKKLENVNNFIMNEATDYQILTILVEDDLSEEKYNYEKEKKLIEQMDIYGKTTPEIEAIKKKIRDHRNDPKNLMASVKQRRELEDQLKDLRYFASTDNEFTKKMLPSSYPSSANQKNRQNSNTTIPKVNTGIKSNDQIRQDIQNKIKNSTTNISASPLKPGEKPSGSITFNKSSAQVPQLPNVINKLKGSAGKVTNAIKNMSPMTKTIGGIGLGALAGYGAYKAYKGYKANSAQKQISSLRQSLSSCSQSANPENCKAMINAKIQKLQQNIG